MESIDVEEFLTRLDIENITDNGNEVVFSCPFEGHAHGDSNPSASMNKETTEFYCFGCSEKGNAISFLAKYANISNSTAYKYIIDIFTPDFKEPETTLYDELAPLLDDVVEVDGEQDIQDYYKETFAIQDWKDQVYNNPPTPAYKYMVLERKFTPEILNKFEISVESPDPIYITIPMYNARGDRMVGVKGRKIDPNAKPKYRVLGDKANDLKRDWGFKTYNVNDYLYNIHRVEPDSDIIIVEGELNAVAMTQMGYPNTVAFGGTALGEKQIEDLLDKAKTVTILFDSDKAGKKAEGHLSSILESQVMVFTIPVEHDDPGDIIKNSSNIQDAQEAMKTLLETKQNTLERYLNESK